MRKLVHIETDIDGTPVALLLNLMKGPGFTSSEKTRYEDELPYKYSAYLGYFERLQVRRFLRSKACKWTMKEVL